MTKTIDALVEALEQLLSLYETDDGCKALPQYVEARAALAQARAEQAEPFGYVSEHNCEGPFKLQFKKTLAEVYRDNFTTITPLYTTPPAALVAKLEPWQPIETAPEGVLVVVCWAVGVVSWNGTEGSNFDFDYMEDGVWQNYFNRTEHYAIAGANVGRPEDAPYTHWMPLTPPPAEAAHNAKLGGAG